MDKPLDITQDRLLSEPRYRESLRAAFSGQIMAGFAANYSTSPDAFPPDFEPGGAAPCSPEADLPDSVANRIAAAAASCARRWADALIKELER